MDYTNVVQNDENLFLCDKTLKKILICVKIWKNNLTWEVDQIIDHSIYVWKTDFKYSLYLSLIEHYTHEIQKSEDVFSPKSAKTISYP